MDEDKLPACPIDPFLSTLSDWLRVDFWAYRVELAAEKMLDPRDPATFRAACEAMQVAAHNIRRVSAVPRQMPLVDMTTGETVQEYAARVIRYRLGADDRADTFPGHDTDLGSPTRAANGPDGTIGPNPPTNGPGGRGGGQRSALRPPVPRAPRPGGAAVAVPVP